VSFVRAACGILPRSAPIEAPSKPDGGATVAVVDVEDGDHGEPGPRIDTGEDCHFILYSIEQSHDRPI
jgi:hypothetical protein